MKTKTKKIIFICALLTFPLFISSCSNQIITDKLTLSGDVDEWIYINDIWNDTKKESFIIDDKKYRGVDLQSLVEIGGIQSNDYNVYLKSSDGYIARLDGSSISDTYISYSKEFGFHYLSNKHPVNSRVKFISDIIIRQHCDSFSTPNVGINLVSYDNQLHISIGELLTNSYEVLPQKNGTTSQSGNTIDVFSQKKVIRLSSLWKDEITSILLMDSDGHHEYLYIADGYFEVGHNQINFFTDSENVYFNDIEGIIINPPSTSVMDTFYDAAYYLQDDENVLLLFLDGFSYNQYEYARDKYPQLFISQITDVRMTTTVFKPVTNAGFAAMITGEPPIESGVFNRDYRQIHCPTIFDVANDLKASTLLIEGKTKILNTDSEIILNIDTNNDEYTDDEIYECAVRNLSLNHDFVLVHFHSIDDAGHNNGPFGTDTINQIKTIDEYIKTLASMWNGKIIITADHGMHETMTGGSHGEFRYEDMYIPYMIIDGGLNEK